MKIKKGDKVLVISGKYRGKVGKVIKALPKRKKLLVEGVNIVKKHIRPRREGEKGQIIQTPSPIDVSNVKLICQKCGKEMINAIDNTTKKLVFIYGNVNVVQI